MRAFNSSTGSEVLGLRRPPRNYIRLFSLLQQLLADLPQVFTGVQLFNLEDIALEFHHTDGGVMMIVLPETA